MSSLHLTSRNRVPRAITPRAIASFALGLFVIIAACSLPPAVCPSGKTSCNGACVDLSSDPNHCGSCGTSCDALFCSASTCSATCGVGLSACGQSCVNLAADPANCGLCGNACAPGAACSVSVCQGAPTGTGGAPGVGGTVGTGGVISGSGAVTGTGGGSGAVTGSGGVSNSLLGGYHVHGDWAGFAFTFTDTAKTATITPENYEDMINQDGPYCVSGTVANTEEYTSIAAVGFNVSQPKIENAPVNKIASTGDGVLIDITVNSGSDLLRVQLEDGTDPAAADAALHRWCANLSVVDGAYNDTLPWEAFSTECWAPGTETDIPFDKREIAKVIVYVPDEGPDGAALPFDFCVNDIGPANVMSRGTGEIVANCGTNVTWQSGSTNQQFANISTSDNRYQFQNNGWGWVNGGSHSVSLLGTNGFHMDSQTCSRTDDSPCSFPSIYIGTDADGTRTSGGGLPKLLSSITSGAHVPRLGERGHARIGRVQRVVRRLVQHQCASHECLEVPDGLAARSPELPTGRYDPHCHGRHR